MAVDLCMELTAGFVHALEITWTDLLLVGRRSERALPQRHTKHMPDAAFDASVQDSLDGLAFDQAQTLWLIDVCGMSYHEASEELNRSYSEVAVLVQEARSRIRAQLL